MNTRFKKFMVAWRLSTPCSPLLALHTSQVLHPIPPEKDKHDVQAIVTWELYFHLDKHPGETHQVCNLFF